MNLVLFSGYSYYWNRESDLVTWLHPLDEDAVITLAASKLAEAVAAKKLAETNVRKNINLVSTLSRGAQPFFRYKYKFEQKQPVAVTFLC